MSWDQRFFAPVIVLGRKPLTTLRDAALYITKLPKTEHDTEEWQAAMQALMLVAEHNGPTMFARIVGRSGLGSSSIAHADYVGEESRERRNGQASGHQLQFWNSRARPSEATKTVFASQLKRLIVGLSE